MLNLLRFFVLKAYLIKNPEFEESWLADRDNALKETTALQMEASIASKEAEEREKEKKHSRKEEDKSSSKKRKKKRYVCFSSFRRL